MRRSALLLSFLVAVSTLFGLVSPTAQAAVGPPTSSVANPFVGQEFTLSGTTGAAAARPVKLQRLSGKWKDAASGTTAADGSYRFTTSTTAAERSFRVVAPASGSLAAVTTPAIKIKTRTDSARLVLSRNRSTGIALGFSAVRTNGRLWALQVKRSSGWSQVGAKVVESGGRINATFPLGAHSYRLLGDPIPGSPHGTSPTTSIGSGPKSLGKHVVFVATNSGYTPTRKGHDYTGTASVDNGAPMQLETIAVRGNSSARKPKKPYKLKFIDSQTPVGLPRGKTFILLPNYQDHSLVRTAVGIGAVAAKLDGLQWTPHRAFTELFINGKYLGSYEIIETVKIQQKSKKNDARVPIDEETGVITEINPNNDDGSVLGLFKGGHGMYYGFKDPDEVKYKKDGKTLDPEGVTPDKIAKTRKKILAFEKVLYSKDYKNSKTGWTKYLDLNSAVDYYLADEFIKDWDGDFYRSTYFYTNDYADPNAKFFMGPIWDIDRSAAVKTTKPYAASSPQGWFVDGTGTGHPKSDDVHHKHWMVRITKDPAFQRALRARWKNTHTVFKNAGDHAVDAAVSELGKGVAANDRKLWQKSQPANRYLPRAKTYNGEISFLKNWYQARYRWMNGKLG